MPTSGIKTFKVTENAKPFTKPKPYFNYNTISAGYIRLMEIFEPASAHKLEEPLEISLISVPLHSCPAYVALSYTWGEPSPFIDPSTLVFTKVPRCYPIKCNKQIVLVTRNLRDALRRLRQGQYLRRHQMKPFDG